MSDIDNTGKAELIAGIENGAKQEAENILKQAKDYVADRRDSCEKKTAEIKKENNERINLQVEEIKKSFNSSVTVEKRRIALKIRDRVINKVITQVRDELETLISKPGYREILKDWIVEGAMGLQAEEAEVNASKEEIGMIDEALLKEAEGKVEELSGRKVKLLKTTKNPVIGQGVVITAADKRTAFNNQVKTRLLRYQTELRKIIYDSLFKD